MSQSEQEENAGRSVEKWEPEVDTVQQKMEATMEESASVSSVLPQISSTEQAPKQESWLWNWFSFPFLSGLNWLGERSRTLPEPVCCQLEGKRASNKMCPECEIVFCKKCETLHYSRAFIEHGLLGHCTESLPEILSPAISAGKTEGEKKLGGIRSSPQCVGGT
uniref:DUF4637 domain-containing protein n=1 Tax=Salvator merianae TaxID=96440 RepID=A0A8D0DKK9_SALMN